MTRRTLILPISSICVMIVMAYIWHTTGTRHIRTPIEGKQVPDPSSYAAEENSSILSLHKAPSYDIYVDEKEKISPSPIMPNTEDEGKIPFLPNTLPYTSSLRSTDALQQELWTTHLYQYLQSLNKSISPQVNMVFGDSDHMELVLNWIIAALVRLDPPLHNIMVLSLDQSLCDFLASKKVPVACIAVPPESILASPGPKSWGQGVASRFLVLRIINFWGYDVASYDCDAVLLRNLQPLYDSNPDVKLFAGSGTSPSAMSNQWGFSLCSCVLLLRSHPSIGMCKYPYFVCISKYLLFSIFTTWKCGSFASFALSNGFALNHHYNYISKGVG